MEKYKILLADDHLMLCHGIKTVINEKPDLQVIGEAHDGSELLRMLKRLTPDLIILDISMPKIRGIEATTEIKALYPGVKVLILTMHNDTQYLRHALAAGADGYLLKEDAPTEIFTAISNIRQGGTYITPLLYSEMTKEMSRAYQTGSYTINAEPLTLREREVLKLIAEEKTNKEIAELFSISLRTVQNHRSAIMKKLNIHKTAGLVKYAIREGYTTYR